MANDVGVSVLLGVTLKDVRQIDNDRIVFTAEDDREWAMLHSQDCCESVTVEDICGDLKDLIGSPIVQAEESQSGERPEDRPKKENEYIESETWTFYRLATAKGQVVIRWLGESNGYYSESVDFVEI